MPRPLIVVGDGPGRQTGLARIARDLCVHLWKLHLRQPESRFALYQVGWDDGLSRVSAPWPLFTFSDIGEDWGLAAITEVIDQCSSGQAPIVFTVWDPARCFALAHLNRPIERWGYFAVDAENLHGRLSGVAREALVRYDRVLAYTRWGAGVIGRTIGHEVPWLPHGLGPAFALAHDPHQIEEVLSRLGPWVRDEARLIGCVATNQARKDLPLFFGALHELRRRGHRIYGWLKTDVLVKDWAIGQLVEDFELRRAVTIITAPWLDADLAALYSCSVVTIAPGLGEGFGYPIVESLACGTPVVHGTSGGGAELVPRAEWRFPERAGRLESCHALNRPVYTWVDVANAAERAIRWREQEERIVQEYCAGSVAHLAWRRFWPRWQAWIEEGL